MIQEARILDADKGRSSFPRPDGVIRTSFSRLKVAEKDIGQYWRQHVLGIEQEPDSEVFQLGRLLHQLLLGGSENFLVKPVFKGKGAKAKAIQWAADHFNATLVTKSLHDTAHRMADAIRESPWWQENVAPDCQIRTEVPVYLRNDRFLIRGYLDILSLDQAFLIDIKSCTDVRPDAFRRQFFESRYHGQAAIYHDIVQTASGVTPQVVYLAVSKPPKIRVAPHPVSQEFLELGRAWVAVQMRKILDAHLTCNPQDVNDIPLEPYERGEIDLKPTRWMKAA